MTRKIPVGLQLYTLREETAKDFPGTLRKVADLGFKVLEFAGYGDLSADEMKALLAETGLQAVSAHVSYDLLTNDLDNQIAYAKAIGIEYLIIPFYEEDKLKNLSTFNEAVDSFSRIGEKVKAAGLKLCYHNHAFELDTHEDEIILDRIFRSIDKSLLEMELDLYWVKKGGLNPKDYLLSYTGRVPLVHVKDMTKDEEGFFAEVGYGSMDYPSILEAAKEAGVQYFLVEQDVCRRPALESIKMSIDYLKSIGIA